VLIEQNVGESDFFNRSWAEFSVGFNDSSGNYWFGNYLLSQLTQRDRYKLRLQLRSGSWYWAEYSTLAVSSEKGNYRLLVSGYLGNIGGDSLGWHNGMMFTTYDRDNDLWTDSAYDGNCAVKYDGRFWHNDCVRCRVNTSGSRKYDFTWYIATDWTSPSADIRHEAHRLDARSNDGQLSHWLYRLLT